MKVSWLPQQSLLLALLSIIDAWCWVWPGSTSTLGEVAENVIRSLGVGGVEESTSHHLQAILLLQGRETYNPGAQDGGVTGGLLDVRHVNLYMKCVELSKYLIHDLPAHSSASIPELSSHEELFPVFVQLLFHSLSSQTQKEEYSS